MQHLTHVFVYFLTLNGFIRAVRAMNETLKQNRLLREQHDDNPYSYSSNDRNRGSDLQKNVCFSFGFIYAICYQSRIFMNGILICVIYDLDIHNCALYVIHLCPPLTNLNLFESLTIIPLLQFTLTSVVPQKIYICLIFQKVPFILWRQFSPFCSSHEISDIFLVTSGTASQIAVNITIINSYNSFLQQPFSQQCA